MPSTEMQQEAQRRIVEALLRPEAYPHPVVEPIRVRETHISWVFLTGRRAYKMKKALKWSWIDYSTLEKRRAFCEKEVRLNKRLAPGVYLGVAPVARQGNSFAVAPRSKGEAVEYLVEMRELPEQALLSERFKRGWRIPGELVKRLARLIAGFHESAATSRKISAFGALPFVRAKVFENFSVLEEAGWKLSGERARVAEFIRENKDLFAERVRRGRIRDCHGDLRSESIFVVGEGPRARIYVTDCIEFSDRLRFTDVAEDLAFLAMDWDYRRQWTASDLLEREYAKESGDENAVKLLPFYKHYRAMVRAKVAAFRAEQTKNAREKKSLENQVEALAALAKNYVF